MSIASEITRLQGVKADILTAIGNKGVTVPAGSALDDCPTLIGQIGEDLSKFTYFYNSAFINNGKSILTSSSVRHFCCSSNYFVFPNKIKIVVGFNPSSLSNESYLIMAGSVSASGLAIYIDNNGLHIWEPEHSDDKDYSLSLNTNTNYIFELECIDSKNYRVRLTDEDSSTILLDYLETFSHDISWSGYLAFGGFRYGAHEPTNYSLVGTIDLEKTKVYDLENNVLLWGV